MCKITDGPEEDILFKLFATQCEICLDIERDGRYIPITGIELGSIRVIKPHVLLLQGRCLLIIQSHSYEHEFVAKYDGTKRRGEIIFI